MANKSGGAFGIAPGPEQCRFHAVDEVQALADPNSKIAQEYQAVVDKYKGKDDLAGFQREKDKIWERHFVEVEPGTSNSTQAKIATPTQKIKPIPTKSTVSNRFIPDYTKYPPRVPLPPSPLPLPPLQVPVPPLKRPCCDFDDDAIAGILAGSTGGPLSPPFPSYDDPMLPSFHNHYNYDFINNNNAMNSMEPLSKDELNRLEMEELLASFGDGNFDMSNGIAGGSAGDFGMKGTGSANDDGFFDNDDYISPDLLSPSPLSPAPLSPANSNSPFASAAGDLPSAVNTLPPAYVSPAQVSLPTSLPAFSSGIDLPSPELSPPSSVRSTPAVEGVKKLSTRKKRRIAFESEDSDSEDEVEVEVSRSSTSASFSGPTTRGTNIIKIPAILDRRRAAPLATVGSKKDVSSESSDSDEYRDPPPRMARQKSTTTAAPSPRLHSTPTSKPAQRNNKKARVELEDYSEEAGIGAAGTAKAIRKPNYKKRMRVNGKIMCEPCKVAKTFKQVNLTSIWKNNDPKTRVKMEAWLCAGCQIGADSIDGARVLRTCVDCKTMTGTAGLKWLRLGAGWICGGCGNKDLTCAGCSSDLVGNSRRCRANDLEIGIKVFWRCQKHHRN